VLIVPTENAWLIIPGTSAYWWWLQASLPTVIVTSPVMRSSRFKPVTRTSPDLFCHLSGSLLVRHENHCTARPFNFWITAPPAIIIIIIIIIQLYIIYMTSQQVQSQLLNQKCGYWCLHYRGTIARINSPKASVLIMTTNSVALVRGRTIPTKSVKSREVIHEDLRRAIHDLAHRWVRSCRLPDLDRKCEHVTAFCQ
jgi:hypothetical protein